MNQSTRIVVSMVLMISGVIAVGFGFTGIDFAIAHDLWSPNGDGERTTNFPIFGTIDVVLAFQYSMATLAAGFLMIIIGAHFAIPNASTIKNIAKIVGGAALVAWAIWGVAFSFATIEHRMIVHIDAVDIPCLAPEDGDPICRFTSTEWLFLNFAMAIVGVILAYVGASHTRIVRMRR